MYFNITLPSTLLPCWLRVQTNSPLFYHFSIVSWSVRVIQVFTMKVSNCFFLSLWSINILLTKIFSITFTAQAVANLALIREILDSTPSWNSTTLIEVFRHLPQPFCTNTGIIPQLFLLFPFNLTVHKTFYHLTLVNWATDSVIK